MTDQTSAATPQSSASSRWADSAHGIATPEASTCARGASAGGEPAAGAYLYMPRKIPASRPSMPGAAGWTYGSL